MLSVPVKAAAVGNEIVVSVGRRQDGAIDGGAMITVLPFMASREIPMRGGETLNMPISCATSFRSAAGTESR